MKIIFLVVKTELTCISEKSWFEKHTPKVYADLVINQTPIKKLTQWVECIKKNDHNLPTCALIVGPNGCGKSLSATIICELFNFNIIYFDALHFRKKNSLKTTLLDVLASENITCFMKDKKQSIIILDRIDELGMQQIGNLSKIIHPHRKNAKFKPTHKSNPIICICNNKYTKATKSFTDKTFKIEFKQPSYDALCHMMKQICTTEHLVMNESMCDKIINHTKRDIRKIKQILYDLSNLTANKNQITESTLEIIFKRNAAKDHDVQLFNAATNLLTNYNNLNHSDKNHLFFVDVVKIPLLIQENYLNMINSDYDDMSTAQTIAHNISDGDIIFNHIKSNNMWQFSEMWSPALTLMPCHTLNSQKKHATTQVNLNFPVIFGKTTSVTRKIEHLNNIKLVIPSCKNIHLSILIKIILNQITNIDILIQTAALNKLKKYGKTHADILNCILSLAKIYPDNIYKSIISTKNQKHILSLLDDKLNLMSN